MPLISCAPEGLSGVFGRAVLALRKRAASLPRPCRADPPKPSGARRGIGGCGRIAKLFIPAKAMRCPICKFGFMIDSLSNVTLDSGKAVLIFKNVPAKVCNNCGEEYFEGNITASILTQASSPLSQSSQFQVRRFDW
ncbi:type II toxin-antitoxin system MqsA family antitoxin [Methylomonas aurea]|uniref:type II toxin-antitoxin system MqsA family antitoxin n=1 Tax=Methylomonas aurea TaxID=2952224 RepID=UPI0035319FB8